VVVSSVPGLECDQRQHTGLVLKSEENDAHGPDTMDGALAGAYAELR